jgi:AraC family transcriptional regulator
MRFREFDLTGLSLKTGPVEGWAVDGAVDPRAFVAVNVGAEPFVVERREGALVRRERVDPGSLWVSPAAAPMRHRVRGASAFVRALIDPAIARDAGGGEGVELRLAVGADAPPIAHLLRALVAEAEAGGPNGRAFTRSITEVLWRALVRAFAARPDRTPGSTAPLTRRQLGAVLDFIDAKLGEGASTAERASIAGLSPFHFSRVFKAAVGESPHQYVMRRRAERARELLAHGDAEIAHVAHVLGYADQSHLSRELRRRFGVSPRALRLRGESASVPRK